jgi:hypothetical protein
MFSDGSYQFPSVQIPDFDGFLGTPTNNNLPIRADGDAINLVWMTCKGSYQFPGVQIPDFDGFVVTPTHNDVPIRADGDAINLV